MFHTITHNIAEKRYISRERNDKYLMQKKSPELGGILLGIEVVKTKVMKLLLPS